MIKEIQPVFVLHDQGYKLGPPGGLTDAIRNVRTVRKTPGWVIWEETAVLMRLLSRYQEDLTCSGFFMTGATSWDHLEASLTPSGMSGMSGRPRMGHFGGEGSLDWIIVKVSKKFNLFWIAHDQGYKLEPPGGLTDPIRNVRNVRKTPGWVILEDTAVLMGLVSRYPGDSTCSGFLITGATN